MKKKINRGVILTLAVLLCVSLVAYKQAGKLSKEKEAACAVVTAALEEYLNARTLPFDVRMDLKNNNEYKEKDHMRLIDEKLESYEEYLKTVMFAPESKATQLYIDEMVLSARNNLSRQYSRKTPIDGYVLEVLHNTKIGFLKGDFSINADFTEIRVTVEYKVIYSDQSTSTERTYNLIKVDGEWKLNTVLNLYGVS